MDADTVRNQLGYMNAEGLVAKDGGTWRILDSRRLDERFEVLRKPQNNERVGDRFCYVRTHLPTTEGRKSGLTLNTAMLYWRLVDWAQEINDTGGLGAIRPSMAGQRGCRQGLSIPYLVKAMRNDPKTIRTSLVRLEKLGLIRRSELGTGRFAVVIPVEQGQCRFWRNTWTEQSPATFKDLVGVSAAAMPAITELPDSQKLFMQAGIPGSMHLELLELIEKAGLEMYEWQPLLLQCKNDNDQNRATGRTEAHHPGRLFHYELSKRVKTKGTSLAYQPFGGTMDLALSSLRRIPGSSERLVRLVEEAVSNRTVPAGAGIAVPVPVSWHDVSKMASNSTFDGFRRNFVKAIFSSPSIGESPWLDKMMSLTAIPDDTWETLRDVMGKSLRTQHGLAWEQVLEWAESHWDDPGIAFDRTREIVDAALGRLRPVRPPKFPDQTDFWRHCLSYIEYMSPAWFDEHPSDPTLPSFLPETAQDEVMEVA